MPILLITTLSIMFAISAPLMGQTLPDVERATGITSGLLVHLGATDGQLAADAAVSGRTVAQVLATDKDTTSRIRQMLTSKGVYGIATARTASDFQRLPYADNLANLLVVDADGLGAKAPADAELMRIVAPQGAAYVRKNGTWSVRTKPLPAEMDGWTHFYHGPDGNPLSQDKLVKPSTGVQWLAGARATGDQATSCFRLDGGLALYEWVSPYRRKGGPEPHYFLVCRDAFSGVLRWTRGFHGWTFKTRPLVMIDGRIYMHEEMTGPLVALDARTGQTIQTYDKSLRARQTTDRRADINLLVHQGNIIQTAGNSVQLMNAKTGDVVWRFDAPADTFIDWPVLQADGARLFVCIGQENRGHGRYPWVAAQTIRALNLADGKMLWENPLGQNLGSIFHHGGALYAFASRSMNKNVLGPQMWRLDPTTGKIVWHTDPKHANQILDAVAVGENVWAVSGDIIRFSAADGNSSVFKGSNSRCEMGRATVNYLLPPFGGFVPLDKPIPDQIERTAIARGTCGDGVTPGYGMVFYGPNRCSCFESIRAFQALSSQTIPEPIADERRLVAGKRAVVQDGAWPAPGDWPMLMGNPQRSSFVATGLPAKPRILWQTKLARAWSWDKNPLAQEPSMSSNYNGPLTGAAAAHGLVVVAAPEEHRVIALDPARGERKWEFTADARIDTPPTLYRGLCLFGARDGWVYCLDAADGSLAWKFLAAPSDRSIMAYNQLESAWPLFGSVLVHNDIAIVIAGRHPDADGGMIAWGLDAATGATRWKTPIRLQREAVSLQGKQTNFPTSRVLNEVLVTDGKLVTARGIVFDPATGKILDTAAMGKKSQPLMDPAFGIGTSPAYRGLGDNFGGPGPGGGSSSFESSKAPNAKVRGFQIAWSPDHIVSVGLNYVPVHAWKTTNGQRVVGEFNSKVASDAVLTSSAMKGFFISSSLLAGERGEILVLASRNRTAIAEATTGELRLYNAKDLTQIGPSHPLPAGAVGAGLAAAHGRIYVSCDDGTLICIGE